MTAMFVDAIGKKGCGNRKMVNHFPPSADKKSIGKARRSRSNYHSLSPATEGGRKMTSRKAIQVLMLSPIYFRLKLRDRRQLIRHYCMLFSSVGKKAAVETEEK